MGVLPVDYVCVFLGLFFFFLLRILAKLIFFPKLLGASVIFPHVCACVRIVCVIALLISSYSLAASNSLVARELVFGGGGGGFWSAVLCTKLQHHSIDVSGVSSCSMCAKGMCLSCQSV